MPINKYEMLYDQHQAKMLQDADDAITSCGLWEWLGEYKPEKDRGFMFSDHPNLDKINSEMKMYDLHSGSSYAWTMHTMQKIARLGWGRFAEVVSTDHPPCPCRQQKGFWAGSCRTACEH